MLPNTERKLGILTSGGDAPGMNATIRAVVRSAIHYGFKVIGIRRGYEGLLSADIVDLNAKSVSDIVHRGGTILLTARCKEMMTAEGKDKAARICQVLGLDGLVVIGGDGSLSGARELAKRGVNVLGIPGTIDLDLPFTEYTIGFDTAVNTGMDAINKIRDTSSSHERCSVVEVMGRNSGQIALWCGVVGGAEEIIVPENGGQNIQAVVEQIIKNRSKGKTHNLILVAEGIGGSVALAKEIQELTGIVTRATVLGYLQRGGSPTAVDRMHASLMGFMAVELAEKKEWNKVISYRNGKHEAIDIEEALSMPAIYDNKLYNIAKILAI